MKQSKTQSILRNLKVDQAKEQIQDLSAEISEMVREQLKDFEPEISRAKNFIKKHPLVSVAAAGMLGFILGRFVRRSRFSQDQRSER